MKGTIWAALFGLLVQALLPGVLHAGAAPGGMFAEICTASGIKKVAVGESDAPATASLGEDCLICVVGHSPALPVETPVWHAHSPLAFELVHPAGIPRNTLTRASLHLRGPPVRI